MKMLLFLFLLPFCVNAQNCQDIRNIPRKNTKLKVFESPDSNAVQFTKDVLGKSATYRIRLRMMRTAIDLGQKGIVIFFEDGTKLEKPEESVDVNNLDGKFEFTGTLTLLPEELAIFQKKKISGFKLFTYQKDIPVASGEKFRNYANCIVSKK